MNTGVDHLASCQMKSLDKRTSVVSSRSNAAMTLVPCNRERLKLFSYEQSSLSTFSNSNKIFSKRPNMFKINPGGIGKNEHSNQMKDKWEKFKTLWPKKQTNKKTLWPVLTA